MNFSSGSGQRRTGGEKMAAHRLESRVIKTTPLFAQLGNPFIPLPSPPSLGWPSLSSPKFVCCFYAANQTSIHATC